MIDTCIPIKGGFPVAQMVMNLPAVQETWVRSLRWEDLLEKGMATNSSILAWRIPWTEEPGKLEFMGSHWVRHNWSNLACVQQVWGWHLLVDLICIYLIISGIEHLFMCLFIILFIILYAEYIMRNAGLEEGQAGIKIAGRNINNLR